MSLSALLHYRNTGLTICKSSAAATRAILVLVLQLSFYSCWMFELHAPSLNDCADSEQCDILGELSQLRQCGTSSTALPTRASNSCSDLSGRERTGGCCQSGLRGSLCIVVILTFATRSCKVCRLRGCRRGCTLQTHPPSNFVDELKTPTAVNTVRCYLVIMTWTNTVGWRASPSADKAGYMLREHPQTQGLRLEAFG